MLPDTLSNYDSSLSTDRNHPLYKRRFGNHPLYSYQQARFGCLCKQYPAAADSPQRYVDAAIGQWRYRHCPHFSRVPAHQQVAPQPTPCRSYRAFRVTLDISNRHDIFG